MNRNIEGNWVTLFLFVTIIWIGVFSCNSIKIFGPEKSNADNSMQKDETILRVKITGGFAGINETIELQTSGSAMVRGAIQANEKRVQLKLEEVSDIFTTFMTNDFFALKSNYISKDVADAFYYDIYFNSGEKEHSVVTNGFDVPQNLSRILEKIHWLENRIMNDGLVLELSVDKQNVTPQDSLRITFTATNTSSENLKIKFTSSQIFDLLAYNSPDLTDEHIIWNWAHGKGFLQVITEREIPAGEVLTSDYLWDGRDNNGNRVKGIVYIVGSLLSTPGGTTRSVQVTFE